MNRETRQNGEPLAQLPPSPPTVEIDRSTLRLLEQWKTEDETSDAAELLAAEREVAEFKEAMDKSRILAGELPLYP